MVALLFSKAVGVICTDRVVFVKKIRKSGFPVKFIGAHRAVLSQQLIPQDRGLSKHIHLIAALEFTAHISKVAK